jgi:hypothetical protein
MNEQAIIQALHNLPVSVQVWPRAGGYAWQCLDGSGVAADLAAAMSAGLTYLIERVAGDSTVIDDLSVT